MSVSRRDVEDWVEQVVDAIEGLKPADETWLTIVLAVVAALVTIGVGALSAWWNRRATFDALARQTKLDEEAQSRRRDDDEAFALRREAAQKDAQLELERRALRAEVVSVARSAVRLAVEQKSGDPVEVKRATHRAIRDAVAMCRTETNADAAFAMAMWMQDSLQRLATTDTSSWNIAASEEATMLLPLIQWQFGERSTASFGKVWEEQVAEREARLQEMYDRLDVGAGEDANGDPAVNETGPAVGRTKDES